MKVCHHHHPPHHQCCQFCHCHPPNRKIQSTQQGHKCHTMLVQDSFLGSLLVLPVELTRGIVG